MLLKVEFSLETRSVKDLSGLLPVHQGLSSQNTWLGQGSCSSLKLKVEKAASLFQVGGQNDGQGGQKYCWITMP